MSECHRDGGVCVCGEGDVSRGDTSAAFWRRMPMRRSGQKERGSATVDRMDVAGQWWKRNGARAKGREARD